MLEKSRMSRSSARLKARKKNEGESNWNCKTFGLSLPKPLLKEVDLTRGDINRSRFIQRIIERSLELEQKMKIEMEMIRMKSYQDNSINPTGY